MTGIRHRKEIHSPQPSLRFYNASTGLIQDSVWEELDNGLWKQYSIDNRLFNGALGEMRIGEWKPVFPDITPIYPGYAWNPQTRQLEEKRFTPDIQSDADMDSFLAAAYRFFERLNGKKIGVHLSGGLDSGIIICLLRHFGIPFVLGGGYSSRYEFRTERQIQDILGAYGEDTFLVDTEEYPFYSCLMDMPRHQIPDSYIKSTSLSECLADGFHKRGVEVVLSGQGADTLFVDAVPVNSRHSYNIENEFAAPFESDLIYAPHGIQLLSFYGDKDIIGQINSLRQGQRQDVYKMWARGFFRDFLPRELSDYVYCADFFGISMSGLESAKSDIVKLFEEARSLLPHPLFSEQNTRQMIETNVFDFDYKAYCRFCTQISIAVWLHALLR